MENLMSLSEKRYQSTEKSFPKNHKALYPTKKKLLTKTLKSIQTKQNDKENNININNKKPMVNEYNSMSKHSNIINVAKTQDFKSGSFITKYDDILKNNKRGSYQFNYSPIERYKVIKANNSQEIYNDKKKYKISICSYKHDENYKFKKKENNLIGLTSLINNTENNNNFNNTNKYMNYNIYQMLNNTSIFNNVNSNINNNSTSFGVLTSNLHKNNSNDKISKIPIQSERGEKKLEKKTHKISFYKKIQLEKFATGNSIISKSPKFKSKTLTPDKLTCPTSTCVNYICDKKQKEEKLQKNINLNFLSNISGRSISNNSTKKTHKEHNTTNYNYFTKKNQTIKNKKNNNNNILKKNSKSPISNVTNTINNILKNIELKNEKKDKDKEKNKEFMNKDKDKEILIKDKDKELANKINNLKTINDKKNIKYIKKSTFKLKMTHTNEQNNNFKNKQYKENLKDSSSKQCKDSSNNNNNSNNNKCNNGNAITNNCSNTNNNNYNNINNNLNNNNNNNNNNNTNNNTNSNTNNNSSNNNTNSENGTAIAGISLPKKNVLKNIVFSPNLKQQERNKDKKKEKELSLKEKEIEIEKDIFKNLNINDNIIKTTKNNLNTNSVISKVKNSTNKKKQNSLNIAITKNLKLSTNIYKKELDFLKNNKCPVQSENNQNFSQKTSPMNKCTKSNKNSVKLPNNSKEDCKTIKKQPTKQVKKQSSNFKPKSKKESSDNQNSKLNTNTNLDTNMISTKSFPSSKKIMPTETKNKIGHFKSDQKSPIENKPQSDDIQKGNKTWQKYELLNQKNDVFAGTGATGPNIDTTIFENENESSNFIKNISTLNRGDLQSNDHDDLNNYFKRNLFIFNNEYRNELTKNFYGLEEYEKIKQQNDKNYNLYKATSDIKPIEPLNIDQEKNKLNEENDNFKPINYNDNRDTLTTNLFKNDNLSNRDSSIMTNLFSNSYNSDLYKNLETIQSHKIKYQSNKVLQTKEKDGEEIIDFMDETNDLLCNNNCDDDSKINLDLDNIKNNIANKIYNKEDNENDKTLCLFQSIIQKNLELRNKSSNKKNKVKINNNTINNNTINNNTNNNNNNTNNNNNIKPNNNCSDKINNNNNNVKINNTNRKITDGPFSNKNLNENNFSARSNNFHFNNEYDNKQVPYLKHLQNNRISDNLQKTKTITENVYDLIDGNNSILLYGNNNKKSPDQLDGQIKFAEGDNDDEFFVNHKKRALNDYSRESSDSTIRNLSISTSRRKEITFIETLSIPIQNLLNKIKGKE